MRKLPAFAIGPPDGRCQGVVFPHPLDIGRYVELGLAAIVAHVANFAEDRTLAPRAIVDAADGPGRSRIAVRIAAVDLIPIIQVDHRL